jgi:hypothetical protein
MIEIFPSAVTLLPDVSQEFIGRARDLTPLWCNIDPGAGFVRPNASVAQSIPSGGATQQTGTAESALELVGGVGVVEFTIEAGCLPLQTTGTGHFFITAYFAGSTGLSTWQYIINIDPDSVAISGNGSGSFLHNVAIGDVFRIELSNGFRLFVNGELKNELVTGFVGGIQYPAYFDAQMQNPTGSPSPIIPAPRLSGDWWLREFDSDGDPVVIFTGPTEGTTVQDGATATYSDADTPGAYTLSARIDTGVEIWAEDGLPTGASTLGGSVGSWVNSPPPAPFSGSAELRIPNSAGSHAYIFQGATRTLQILPGDVMTCYVFVPAVNTPSEILLEWKATDGTGFEHRAYWGTDSISNGVNGTPSRRFMGALPATGQWVRLEVPASLVDLEGRVLDGMSFYLFNGACDFDQAGKYAGKVQYAESLIGIPPLRITGETSRTIQPSESLRFQTNYDVGPGATWSVVSGGGSFSGNVFTASSSPGTTVVRATSGEQIADIVINVPEVITPNFPAYGPSEQIDFNTNIGPMPVFIASGTMAEGTGAIVPGLPAGIRVNDILLLFVETANEAVSTPSGWSTVADSPQGTGTAASTTATRLTVFWRRVVGGETAPTIADPGDHAIGQILAFRNCINTGNPWDVTSGDTAASSTSVSIPGDTTTVVNCLVVLAVANQTDSATAQTSGYTNASLANLTERTDVNTTQGNGGGFAVITGEKAAIGAYGATSATLANASVQGRISIALKPALVVWSASAGSMNSSSGLWQAPSVTDQENPVKITATNGTFTAVLNVAVLPLFPFNDVTLPINWKRRRTSLISMSEDRSSRIVREKSSSYDDYEIKLTARPLTDSDAVDAFWDDQGYGKLFILEDKVRNIRKIGWFDSEIEHEGEDTCSHNLSFRFTEAPPEAIG